MKKFMGIILAGGKGTRMKSDLPKVLHKVNDVPMVTHCVTALEKAGAEKIVVVVGYKKELIEEELGDRVTYAVQEEQLGTGHAVQCARDYIKDYRGNVVIAYGDNPLLNYKTLSKMAEIVVQEDCSGTLLAMALEKPPQAGRLIRNENGDFQEIVEEQDCTEEQKKIKEFNCGTYCFKADDLVRGLDQLKPNNNQGEYYLTDVPGILVKDNKVIKIVLAEDIFEILGVNDQEARKFAESAKAIEYAESLYSIIDATLEMERKAKSK